MSKIPQKSECKIGDKLTTEAFGKIEVKDILVSVTDPNLYCYRVESATGESYLCTEEDLID